jgi:hypothetical protein
MPDVDEKQSEQAKQFAAKNAGQQVGDGECYALADQALKAAGAKSADSYGKITPTADYVWGTTVAVGQARGGDVVQFKDYAVTVTVVTKVVKADGSYTEQTRTETMSRPHHTAVVQQTGATGSVSVYEQNVNGSRAVQTNHLPLVSREDAPVVTASEGATTTVTTSVKVTGAAKIYRPQAK